jgi:hypothetical protein
MPRKGRSASSSWKQPSSESFSEQETVRRRDEWLRRSLRTPPKQHKEMVAERKAKRAQRAKPRGKS